MTDKRKWHKGPPPHVGWWNASALRSHRVWRWWNGRQWSLPASPLYSAKEAAGAGNIPAAASDIQWTDYYPANARVPRIAP